MQHEAEDDVLDAEEIGGHVPPGPGQGASGAPPPPPLDEDLDPDEDGDEIAFAPILLFTSWEALISGVPRREGRGGA